MFLVLGAVLIFVLGLVSLIPLVSAANLNLRITGTVNNYNSDVRLSTNSMSITGFDTYDMPVPFSPSNYSHKEKKGTGYQWHCRS